MRGTRPALLGVAHPRTLLVRAAILGCWLAYERSMQQLAARLVRPTFRRSTTPKGIRCGHTRAARLMREHGLLGAGGSQVR